MADGKMFLIQNLFYINHGLSCVTKQEGEWAEIYKSDSKQKKN
jgi:hypothetical protein